MNDKKNIAGKISWRPGTMLYPVPAVMVGCGAPGAGYNIITVAWTGIVCSDPAMCYISVRPERHSYRLISESREFTVNLTNDALAFAADWCGVKSGRDVDKFKEMNLTAVPGSQVQAPFIKESPVNLECRVSQVIPLGTHHLFLAEIIAVHASAEYLDKTTGALDMSKASLIAYAHGHYYQLGRKIGKFGFSVEKKKKKKGDHAASSVSMSRAGKPGTSAGRRPVNRAHRGRVNKKIHGA